jgi:hypothetical protein
MVEGIHYLNSGDWVESMTAIVEHHDGRFELIHFTDFEHEHPMPVPGTEPVEENPAAEPAEVAAVK